MKKPPGKWIEGLRSDDPIVETACRVLKVRLAAVEMMLPLAQERAAEDDEYVHQLRVATRRADTALRLFRPCIPKTRYRKARKRLRRIRRATAIARQCDVHLVELQTRRDASENGVRRLLDDAIAWTVSERIDAQREVREVARRYPARKLARAHRRLLEGLFDPRQLGDDETHRGQHCFHDLALASMPALVARLEKAAAADLTHLENLHDLRLRGKRVRYAMEVFAPCFGPDFRRTYASIESLQESLGDINDSHEIEARVGTVITHCMPEHVNGSTDEAWVRAARSVHQAYGDERDARVRKFLDEWNAGVWADLRAIDTQIANGEHTP